MGLLWRLLAPKPIKKARRTVGRVANPVSALAPKPIKKVQRSVRTVTNPGSAVERMFEDQVVRAIRGGGSGRRRASTPRSRSATPPPGVHATGATTAEVRRWAQRSGIPVSDRGQLPGHVVAAYAKAHQR